MNLAIEQWIEKINRSGLGGLTLEHVLVRGLSFQLDGFRLIYVVIALLMWGMTLLFSREYMAAGKNRGRYYFFVLLTLAGTLGMFLSADLFTTYVFFEIMSLSSYVMVAQEESEDALRAGDTYMAVAVLGGMTMLMGLFLLNEAVGTLKFDELKNACRMCENQGMLRAAAACLLVGFGAKAGVVPLHIWLPKAHPVAPAPASALLSGILTKCGIFGILVIGSRLLPTQTKWGYLILILGLLTMVLGAVLAVFSVNLKRTLACSSMSQIGFILVGAAMITLLGEENAAAVSGTLLHMVNHSLLKLVLFLCAGVVAMNLHALELNEIRGFGRKKPLLHVLFLMGYLGIIGMPGWNGYLSKTLLHESITQYIAQVSSGQMRGLFQAVEGIFLFSGGLTAAYMTKLYLCLFWEKNEREDRQRQMDEMRHYMKPLSAAAILLPALLLPLLGSFPSLVTDRIALLGAPFFLGGAQTEQSSYFAPESLKGAAISLGIGLAVYLLVIRLSLMPRSQAEEGKGRRRYVDLWPKWLDLEELIYRPLLLKVLPFLGALLARICDKLTDTLIFAGKQTIFRERKVPARYKLFAFMRFNSRESSVQREIFNSFSFGLLLFALGLSAVLIYLVLL